MLERKHIEDARGIVSSCRNGHIGWVTRLKVVNLLDKALAALAACDESPWRTIDIFYSPEDGEYVARLSHAHGISAMGLTPADALRELSVVAGMIPDEFLPAAPEVKP